MNPRAWVVGLNETPLLGEGWYDRAPDWFGLPFRESYPRSVLRFPELKTGDKATLLLSSDLAIHVGNQAVRFRLGEQTWEQNLRPPGLASDWQPITLAIQDPSPQSGLSLLEIDSEPWRHGQYEEVQDYREVGVLLAGVFVNR